MHINEPASISDCFYISDAWVKDFGVFFCCSPLKETTSCGLDSYRLSDINVFLDVFGSSVVKYRLSHRGLRFY